MSEHRKGDDAYWAALSSQVNEVGIGAFLHDMLARDVSNFIPSRDVPRDNDEHRENKRASDPANPALWLTGCLDNGIWLGSEEWEGNYAVGNSSVAKLKKAPAPMVSATTLLPAFLESSYRVWAAAQDRHAQAAGAGELWKQLTELGFEPKKSNGRRYRAVPDEAALRAKLKERGFDADDAPSPVKTAAGTAGTVGTAK